MSLRTNKVGSTCGYLLDRPLGRRGLHVELYSSDSVTLLSFLIIRRVIFILFLRTSSARAGGEGDAARHFSSFFFPLLFSRPQAGLATVYEVPGSFFGLATNTLNVRNNNRSDLNVLTRFPLTGGC